MSHYSRRIIANFKKKTFTLAAVLFMLLQVLACSTAPHIVVEALPQYDVLFENRKGWSGGDGVYSVALNQDTIAWFFGDTWIGRGKNDRHVNATVVNNTAAIQQGKAAASATLRFFWGHTDDDRPAALIRPADGRGWFWIFDGAMTPQGLYVFLIQIDRTPGNGVFDFRVVGTWLGHVLNSEESPMLWRITQSKVPWSTFSVSGGMLWGSAILQIDKNLFIYGTVEEAAGEVLHKHMILARVPVSSLADYSQWRFFADGNWVSDFRRAGRLSPNMPHEYSITYLPALKQFAAVYSEEGLSENIMLRLSPEPQGPWSQPIQILKCPEAEWDDSIFCYAAKAHSELTKAPDQLIISYIANSVDFQQAANDARLYRPKFLKVTFIK